MKDKICNSLNSIVLSESQKNYMFQNITKPRNKVGGYILKACIMTACFIFSFTLFSNETSIENNNNMPRTVNYNCEECIDTFENEEYERN